MNQPIQNNPLAQLKGIHTPEAVSSFPLAWGWWVVIAILVAILLVALYLWRRYRRFVAPRRQAIAAIRALTPADPNALKTLNAILKRISLHYDPKGNTASLYGDNWHAYLLTQVSQTQCQKIAEPLSRLQRALYQPTAQCDSQFNDYQQAALTWVKQARITRFTPFSTFKERPSHV